MLEDFLSKLGASTKITVGVSVSPGVGLEMIEVDRLTKTVSKYSSRPLEYNSSTREISDYDQFRLALEDLFDELEIPHKSNIILSVPNVHFGMISLPVLLTDEAITNAIISEVEQSYIFKRQEPVVSWYEIYVNSSSENKTIAYTAVQKDTLDHIEEICEEVGCKLVGLENSYCSLLRALDYIDVAKDQMKEKVSWNLMVIMQNNYSIISMSGKQVVEYYEEPLALKSFVDDEIYNAIRTSAQLTLAGLPANYLFIVSETDLVSAEVLSMGLPSDCPIKFLESNKYVQNEILPVNLNVLQKKALEISIEAIGVATYAISDYPLKLNIIQTQDTPTFDSDGEDYPKINIGNLEVELTPSFVRKIIVILGIVLLIPIIILYMILKTAVLPQEEATYNSLNAQVTSLNSQIKKYQDSAHGNAFDAKTALSNIVSANNTKMAYFDAIGLSVPNKLWITFYYMGGNGKIDIRGASEDVQSIYTFYKTLKQSVNNSDIRLYKLEINSGSIDDFVLASASYGGSYRFEITNMTDAELTPGTGSIADALKTGTSPSAAPGTPGAPSTSGTSAPGAPGLPPAAPGTPAQGGDKNSAPTAGASKSLFQFGKPYFGGIDGPQSSPSLPGSLVPGGKGSPNPLTPPTGPQPSQQGSNPSTSATPTPSQMTPPPTGNGNLPPNLKKIEKF